MSHLAHFPLLVFGNTKRSVGDFTRNKKAGEFLGREDLAAFLVAVADEMDARFAETEETGIAEGAE